LLYPEQQEKLLVDLRNSHAQTDGLLRKLRAMEQREEGARLLDEISGQQREFRAFQERGMSLLQQGHREDAIIVGREGLSRSFALREKQEQFIAYERKQL